MFRQYNKTTKEKKPINNKKKMTKQRSLKTHLAKLGYKLEIALQLKCKGTVAKKQAKIYLRSIVIAWRWKFHCDGDLEAL